MLWVDRRRTPELELEPGCYLKLFHPTAGCVLGVEETAVNEREEVSPCGAWGRDLCKYGNCREWWV